MLLVCVLLVLPMPGFDEVAVLALLSLQNALAVVLVLVLAPKTGALRALLLPPKVGALLVLVLVLTPNAGAALV